MKKKISIFVAFLMMLVGWSQEQEAINIPLDTCVHVLLHKDASRLKEVAGYLVAKDDVTTYPLLSAVVDKRLFSYKGTAVTKFAGDTLYYSVYPKIQVISIQKEKLSEVKLPRSIRTKFNVLAKKVNLVHPNKNVREMSFRSFKTTGVLSDVNFLTSLKINEKEEQVLLAANEAIYSIWLKSNNVALQNKALDDLETEVNVHMLESLTDYVSNTTNSQGKERAAIIIEDIESREKIINVIQNLFSGISLGSILLLVALGLSIIYGLGGVINMSHGEFVMIGAYTAFSVQQFFIGFLPESWFDWFFWVSLPISFVVSGLFGLLVEKLVIRFLYSRPLESLLGTWGVSLILIQLARTIFGDVTAVKSPEILSGGINVTEGLMLPYNRLFIIGLTIVMVLLTYFVFFKSKLGLKIRAVTQNRDMSASLGVSVKRIDSLTFFLGSGLAGVAGCAMTLIGNVVPNMGQTYIVDSFLVVVVGGVGKLIGTIISAMGIGVLSKVFEFFYEAVYGKVILLLIIFFFLQYKPKGLFPDKGRHSDD
ncbi:urea transport system permease protein [Wenyingzhuangia heitensis]|uniref:Urea transport system permease protein n=1 Tax=Wenyingzhuangia heitensis TaxID=1487859 RepID=A0ABX0UEK9_9FLAO|nr:urea ABC transporter permease subunit UrtB [Wenyingzhuangia heitensis]NIJ45966.1 urea transport system permease protein [Wenyingzhuangia heitensis]